MGADPFVVERVARHLFSLFNQRNVTWDGMTRQSREVWRLRARNVLETAQEAAGQGPFAEVDA